jgi:hypothetical protein
MPSGVREGPLNRFGPRKVPTMTEPTGTAPEEDTVDELLHLFRQLTPAQRQIIVDDWRNRLADRIPDAQPT